MHTIVMRWLPWIALAILSYFLWEWVGLTGTALQGASIATASAFVLAACFSSRPRLLRMRARR